jgi:uncharacterized membrane protein required for colicin V production
MSGIPPPNGTDIAALVVIAAGVILGGCQQVSQRTARPLALTVGVLVAVFVHAPLREVLGAHTPLSGSAVGPVSVLSTIFVALAAVMLLGGGLGRLFERWKDRPAAKVIGGVVGFVRSALVVVVVFVLMNVIRNDYLNRVFGSESMIGSSLSRVVPVVRERLGDLPTSAGDGGEGESDDASSDFGVLSGRRRRADDWTEIEKK